MSDEQVPQKTDEEIRELALEHMKDSSFIVIIKTGSKIIKATVNNNDNPMTIEEAISSLELLKLSFIKSVI